MLCNGKWMRMVMRVEEFKVSSSVAAAARSMQRGPAAQRAASSSQRIAVRIPLAHSVQAEHTALLSLHTCSPMKTIQLSSVTEGLATVAERL